MIERLTLNNLVQVAVFLFGALCLTVSSGYSYGPGLLLLLALPLLFQPQSYRQLGKNSQALLMVLLLYVAIRGISLLWDGGSIKEFDRPSRLLMAAAIYLLLRRFPPRFLPLMSGVGLGAILAGGLAFYQRFVMGLERGLSIHNHPIQSGDISMSLGLISLCGFFWAYREHHRKWGVFFGIATLMGITGSLLSGSRGGWIMLPVILVTLYWLHRHWISRGAKIAGTLAACLLMLFCMVPQSGVLQRLAQAKQDLVQYYDGGNRFTSLGIRLQLWNSAWLSFQEKPLFGWGSAGIRESQHQQVVRGELAQQVYDFHFHAHNQYLEELSKRGLPGLAALLGLFLVPIRLFKMRLGPRASPEQHALGVAGVIHVMATMDYCLSQTFFGHNSGITFFVMGVVILLAAARIPAVEITKEGQEEQTKIYNKKSFAI